MKNYELVSVDTILENGRAQLHDILNLTGAEISFNQLPAGVNVPFIHKHKQNEEIYVVLDGSGYLSIDEKTIEIKKGDTFKIAPEGERCIKASSEDSIYFMCVQVKQNSLDGFTQDDGIILEKQPEFN